MNTQHTPRLWKAALAVSVGIVFMSVSVSIRHEKLFWIIFLSGIISAIYGIIEAFMANWGYAQNTAIERLREYRFFLEALKDASVDVKGMLPRVFPEIGLEPVGGEMEYFWHGTRVPVEIFQEFLRESNRESTVAQRNWKARGVSNTETDKKVDYHWCWLAIYKRLVELDYVIPVSHNGPRSELWRGNSYEILCNDWIGKPLRIPNLAESE